MRDDGRFDFAATVRHRDDEVYGTRELLHPHDAEQPFTRSLRAVALPDDVTVVKVHAKCSVHGYGGREVIVDLTRSEGEAYVVQEE